MRLVVTWTFILFLFCPQTSAAQVILNDSVDASAISAEELRLIFSRQKLYWPDGQAIKVFVLAPDSDLHREFCIEELDMLPFMLQRRWDRSVYSGTGDRPEIVKTEQQMMGKVRNTPGAIGYISSHASFPQGEYQFEE